MGAAEKLQQTANVDKPVFDPWTSEKKPRIQDFVPAKADEIMEKAGVSNDSSAMVNELKNITFKLTARGSAGDSLRLAFINAFENVLKQYEKKGQAMSSASWHNENGPTYWLLDSGAAQDMISYYHIPKSIKCRYHHAV